MALGQLQRADSYVPGGWDRSYIALYRGDRETLTRLYESAPALRTWIAPLIGIIVDGGDQRLADLARGPSPETLKWFAETWRMSPGLGWPSLRRAQAYADALVRVGNNGRAIEVLQTATSNRRVMLTLHVSFIGSGRGTPTQNCCVGSVATPRRSPSSATCCRC